MKKHFITTLLILITLAFVAACGTGEEKAGQATHDNEVIASVNGDSIFRSDFEYAIQAMALRTGVDLTTEVEEDTRQFLEEQALEQLIDQKLVVQDAEAKGIEVSQEEVSEQLELLKDQAQFESDEEFVAYLEEQDLTLAEIEDDIRIQMLIGKYFEELQTDITVTEEEVQDYFDEIVAMYGEEFEETPDLEEEREIIEAQVKNEKLMAEVETLVANLRETSDIVINI
ncbi:SurA N-terminal domain-containing protein [Bacillus alkalicellulosilyticus]|uniref:SurA N-terminal domain-containing protein n=1 Tax=Alkalihalobacterium alkalicellulosilyticum TaxID=1912214 RepID=UPI0014830725|nr:SurA N-terminal domain-containing protein [Bacillus alkalicellulosilyticus]